VLTYLSSGIIMGVFDNLIKAVDDYGRKHKEHMVQQWVRGCQTQQGG
jgi:hypothetical protein